MTEIYYNFDTAFCYLYFMKSKIEIILLFLLGGVFLLSGLGKLSDIVAFQYLIVQYGFSSLHIFAPAIVLVEIAIGTMLVLQLKTRPTLLCAIALLLVFTIAYSYAYWVNGITDCGCFGKFEVAAVSPLWVYIRNVVLIVVAVFLMFHKSVDCSAKKFRLVLLIIVMLSSSFMAGMTYRPNAFDTQLHPFTNKHISNTPLIKYVTPDGGDKLLLFYSYGCPHCWSSMSNYRDFMISGVVDTTVAYVAVDSTHVDYEKDKKQFYEFFSDVQAVEIDIETVNSDGIYAMPTSFYIEDDIIKYVVEGTLPSPYLIKIEKE